MKLPFTINNRPIQGNFDWIVSRLLGVSGHELRAFTVNATTGALLTDINAGASVARTAAGRYTVTWTRPWASSAYVVVGSCFAGGSGIGIWSVDGGGAYSATTFSCMTINNTVFADLTWFCIAIGPRV